MPDENKDEQEFEEAPPTLETTAALIRHIERSGRDLEALRLSLENLKEKGVFVYKVELRSPNTKSVDWLCLAKALSEDGPQIAFTNGGSFHSSLTNFGRRLRGGAVEWHEDGYPPDDWPDRLAYLTKNATWFNF